MKLGTTLRVLAGAAAGALAVISTQLTLDNTQHVIVGGALTFLAGLTADVPGVGSNLSPARNEPPYGISVTSPAPAAEAREAPAPSERSLP